MGSSELDLGSAGGGFWGQRGEGSMGIQAVRESAGWGDGVMG